MEHLSKICSVSRFAFRLEKAGSCSQNVRFSTQKKHWKKGIIFLTALLSGIIRRFQESSLVEERRKRLQMYLRRVISHWPELTHCNNRFLLEQHLAFFKWVFSKVFYQERKILNDFRDQQEDEIKRNMLSSRSAGNSSNHSGLWEYVLVFWPMSQQYLFNHSLVK